MAGIVKKKVMFNGLACWVRGKSEKKEWETVWYESLIFGFAGGLYSVCDSSP